MKNRITVALNVLVDLKVNDMTEVKKIIKGLNCSCFDTTGEAKVIGVEIMDRSLLVDEDEEPDAE